MAMTTKEIYLDYNASTPCDHRVVEKMLPFFAENYGNPANGYHRQGRYAAKAVEEAKEEIAELIGGASTEILFTAGATESNNLTILGLARMISNKNRKRIITSAIEHKSVLVPCKELRNFGYEPVILPVDPEGNISLEIAKQAINDETLLVSIQAANNEIGTLQPIMELADLAHERGAIFHCDAAQAIAKIPFDIQQSRVDLLSISAHKLYGPKGIGALFIRGGIKAISLEPLIYGGGQEGGLRPGTLNVPGIVGFGEACRIAHDELEKDATKMCMLRDHLEEDLQSKLKNLKINGNKNYRLPNTSSLIFDGLEADALILNLRNVMIGTGSACSSGAIEPSHVLQAIGLSRDAAYSTVRISLGRYTTEDDIQAASEEIRAAVNNLIHLS